MAVKEVNEVVEAWDRARDRYAEVVLRGNRAVRGAEHRLQRALGGMPLHRWQALVAGRVSLRDPRLARRAHVAARVGSEVETALAAIAEARSSRDTVIRAAEAQLAEAARRLAGYGHLAERVGGCPIERPRRIAAGGR